MGMIRRYLAEKRQRLAAARAERQNRPKSGAVDPILLALAIGLIAFGVVMVFSSSSVFAAQRYGDGHYFLMRQAFFAAVALPVMGLCASFDYRWIRPLTYPILFFVVVLLLFVALGGGHRAGGAARWIAIGSFHVQPAEMAKVALILWLAYSLSKKQESIRTFRIGVLPHVLVMGLLSFLCLWQPDFGSAVMICALTVALLFASGATVRHITALVLCAVVAAVLLVLASGYRMDRIKAFQNPFEHRRGVGYQIAESMISFGSGGVSGLGIGESRQKLFFLPEAHTDFISAIVGEELGFIGVMCLLLAFFCIVIRGLRAAFRAPDDYGMLLAVGLSMFFGLSAFTNLAVAMGMVPTKGLALPFVSYGGSALLVNAAAMGVLLNVSRARETHERESRETHAGRSMRNAALAGGRSS